MRLPHFLKQRKALVVLLGVLVIGAIVGLGIYQYVRLRKELAELRNNPQKIQELARSEQKTLIEKIGKLITLPIDEQPTIATVTDSERLKNQPFFAKALNGDKVLLYANAKKAILYRPSVDKIIEVAPITIGPVNSTTVSGQVAQTPLRLVLYNGTTIIGLTKKYETELKTKVPGAVVVDRDNAKKQDYAKTMLIDLTGTRKDQAQTLAQALGISLSELPLGETKPSAADFLIILGADKK